MTSSTDCADASWRCPRLRFGFVGVYSNYLADQSSLWITPYACANQLIHLLLLCLLLSVAESSKLVSLNPVFCLICTLPRLYFDGYPWYLTLALFYLVLFCHLIIIFVTIHHQIIHCSTFFLPGMMSENTKSLICDPLLHALNLTLFYQSLSPRFVSFYFSISSSHFEGVFPRLPACSASHRKVSK